MSIAQITDDDRSRIVTQIEHSQKSVVPERFPDLTVAKQRVMQRIESVRAEMLSQPSAANGQAWLDYLNLDPIAEAIKEGESAGKLAQSAFDLRFRLIGNLPGLEVDVLRDLRDSVEQLISAIRFRDGDKSVEQLRKQLTDLSARIKELDRIPSSEDASAISAIIGLIDESNQVTEVVSLFREIFGRPNLAVFAGEPIVTRAINREVNNSRPVQDCILGTRIVGNAHTNGCVTATLLPATGMARIQVALSGHVTTNNLGYNGPVRLRTSGTGQIAASRVLNINEQGVTFDPIFTNVALNTQIDAIEHRLGIVRRIAKKKAAQQKPKADRIALAKFQTQVTNEFAKQTGEASGIKRPDLTTKIMPILKRVSLEEPLRTWGSTADYLFIEATVRKQNQIASAVAQPRILGSFEMAVQIEESLVDNVFGPLLAGRTVKESEIDELLARRDEGFTEQTKIKPQTAQNELASDDKKEPTFEIDFARVQPIVFEARDGKVRLGIRGTRFSTGSRDLNVPMEITAMYQPTRTDDGRAILIRDEAINVDFPGQRRLSISQAGLKRNIQEKFNDVFPMSLLDRTFTMPPTVEFEAIRNRQFRPTLIDARKGWLTIAVQ
ncbi:hypothetical protein [Novipirellula aureliae]|uniref:hypothetical protein n=1 Tax=Novipirellula aureliae TaxID=2527966 RepID=UPI0011B8393F|nr:hypothetical protein [Novipirellula aureliae]